MRPHDEPEPSIGEVRMDAEILVADPLAHAGGKADVTLEIHPARVRDRGDALRYHRLFPGAGRLSGHRKGRLRTSARLACAAAAGADRGAVAQAHAPGYDRGRQDQGQLSPAAEPWPISAERASSMELYLECQALVLADKVLAEDLDGELFARMATD
jgi:hypothetical protein